MRRKKGFTLTELIIVLAIMGILLAILVPSWGFYMQRARTRTQNSKAKIIFNAAQTVVTEMQMSERKVINDYNLGNNRDELIKLMYTHCPSGDATKPNPNEWYFYYNGTAGSRVNVAGGPIATGDKSSSDVSLGYNSDYISSVGSSEWNDRLTREISKILDESSTVYKIYVKDYKVQSVVSSRYERDRYLGAFPVNLDKLDKLGVDIDTIRTAYVSGARMTDFDINTSEFTTPGT